MEAILSQFQIEPGNKPSLFTCQQKFNEFLYHNRNRVNTLIIDDAQNLIKKEHIELLRLLQNLETPQHKLLNLVLFGQLDLIPAIKAHPNFEQRVNSAFVLNPLTYEDMTEMIRFRLHKAGLPPGEELFDDESYRTIYEFSLGIPREVVTICRNVLVIAKRIKKRKVQNSIVLYTINNITAKGLVM